MIVDCHVNVYEDSQMLALYAEISRFSRPGGFALKSDPPTVEQAMREDHVGARHLRPAGDLVEHGLARVHDDLQRELVEVAADRARARGRLGQNAELADERLEELAELPTHVGDDGVPARVAAGVRGVEEHRVALDLLEGQRNVDLLQDRLDQPVDDHLAVHRGGLVVDHELRVPADVGQDDDELLLVHLTVSEQLEQVELGLRHAPPDRGVLDARDHA